MLADLTVKDFLDKVACSDPVPGGGSIAALNGALASSLFYDGGTADRRKKRIRSQ